jgi:hypothetical protein
MASGGNGKRPRALFLPMELFTAPDQGFEPVRASFAAMCAK